MNPEEKLKNREYFEKNIQWIKKNVAPDDIYIFAEILLACGKYFFDQWTDLIDYEAEIEKNPASRHFIINFAKIVMAQSQDADFQVKLNIDI